MTFRHFIAGWLAPLALACGPALAADYPVKPVKLVVPLAPGGSADGVARLLAGELGRLWGQPVVVENRAGAAGVIGVSAVARSPADGYTILLTPISITTGHIYNKDPGYDADKSFAHITQLISTHYLVSVNSSLPVNSLAELVSYAKAHPHQIFHGAGAGGMFLAFEEFRELAGIDVEQVNYRGEAPAMSALAAGDVQVVFSSMLAAKPFIDSGRAKPLAFMSPQREPYAPGIPSAPESGVSGLEIAFWFGLSAPAGTPAPIVDKIARDVHKILKRPDVIGKLNDYGFVPHPSTPAEFRQRVATETARWTAVAQRAGIEAQ
ncbi:tripartite tricarboxylate transporter substrate binding protein [Pigmentiphaga sp. CHJ604]|uniref:Bug family tripartite tricarboxylate transporter substrate binding protein n=1 Tax=Pigmentiphaga sp. CHJ604 TaxID=3081984 RepID=UPI0030CC448E